MHAHAVARGIAYHGHKNRPAITKKVVYEDWLMHCYVERYKSNEFVEIYSVWHEEVKVLSDSWASIVGWTEGQVPPTFWNWGTEYALSPYFLKRICVSFAVVFIAILL